MKPIARMWMAAGILLMAGCRSEQPQAGPNGASAANLRPPVLRIELTTAPDIADIPRLMAIDAMRAQGYAIETFAFDDTALTAVALERGDLDLAVFASATGWAAIEKGAPIAVVIDDSMNPTVLAARTDIRQCADLQSKRVAGPNLTGGKALLLTHYIERRCPGTRPSLLVVAGESARVAGLMGAELDAAVVDLAAFESLDRTRPGGFSALVVFADEFPGVAEMSHFARRELTGKYPATVKEWLRALLDARRRIQDPRVLADEFVRRLGMAPALAQETAARYLARNFWDVNGGLTPERVQQNLDFAITAGSLRPGVTASDVADLTFLNAVLDEIGRK